MPDFADTTPTPESDRPTAHRPAAPRSRVLTERIERGADLIGRIDGERIREDVEAKIRRHPLLSVTVSVCAGFLLGRLIRD